MNNKKIGLVLLIATGVALLELVFTDNPLLFVWYPVFCATGFIKAFINIRNETTRKV